MNHALSLCARPVPLCAQRGAGLAKLAHTLLGFSLRGRSLFDFILMRSSVVLRLKKHWSQDLKAPD